MSAVAIDRDGAEAPDSAPGRTDAIENGEAPQRAGPPQDQPEHAPNTREQQIAEHVRYRESVEVSNQCIEARDSWAKAAPVLRAEWDAHKQRYRASCEEQPGRTLPDGGWTGDGNRRLSPEQNAEATKCAADLRDEAITRIGPAMDRIEAADPGRRLAGREHMLKGEDRLKEKISDELTAQPGVTVRGALDVVADGVRFTLQYPAERYAEGVLADVERLKAEGFQLMKLKNLWNSEQYKGVNSQWRAPETGTRCEMQFHTAESLEAKELTHEAYERIRAAAARPTEERDFAEEQALEDFQSRANAVLVKPHGTDAIEDFREKPVKNIG
jgi:hypothetical protein